MEQKKRYRDSNKGQITNESHRKKYQPRRAQLAVKYKHQAKQSRKLTKRQCVELKRRIRRRLERNRLNLNEALRDWFCVQANDEWLDHWYGEVVPAWKDVRLTLNQRISMRYMDRYRNEPDFHLKERLARTLRNCLTKNQYRFSKSLGYHTRDVKQHIESQFTEAMSWEAFCDGAIHVDHIIPKVYFNHSIEREVVDCWSLANLQPLWAADNWSKRDSVDPSTADPTLWARYGDRVPVDKLTGPNSVEFS